MSSSAPHRGLGGGRTNLPDNQFAALANMEDQEVLGEMNPDLTETFDRWHARAGRFNSQQPPHSSPTKKTDQIRRYVWAAKQPVEGGPWLSMPEFPTSSEILHDGDKNNLINTIQGAYESTEEYLRSHYELLREDAIRPLRHAVKDVRDRPQLQESKYSAGVGIYSNVYINGFVFSPRGLAVSVTFSLSRVGKRIYWKQSKRLITGTLVALTPADNMFKSKCVLATVAARPLTALEQNPPGIDLFLASPTDIDINPNEPWLMVESRGSFFEASRHTLLALQKLMRESFPLSEHLVHVQPDVEPPAYLENNPHTDLSSVVALEEALDYENVDVLEDWPKADMMGLDRSQSAALRRIITKRLAIVQGPPGTGKTYVSVQALKVMISNWQLGDPPIIVTCQTNHALDQLLRQVNTFCPDFVRLGGRSKDEDKVKKRTLFEVRMSAGIRYRNPTNKELQELTKRMRVLLSPLEANKGLLTHHLFHNLGLLNDDHAKSLVQGLEGVEGFSRDSPAVEMEIWMGKHLQRVQRHQELDYLDYEYEEVDLDYEVLEELEAETFAKDDDDLETLKGPATLLGDDYTGSLSAHMTDEEVRQLLDTTEDMYHIPAKKRGAIYRFLQKKARLLIQQEFQQLAGRYEYLVQSRRISLWEHDNTLLRDQKVVGMTTTGLSKYRALVESLNPKIILVEEAAETLEAPIIVACVPSLEHLILVGDHQQLRPHCQVRELEGGAVNFDLSLFERMVINQVEYDSLKRQRRMIPEIRRLLKPLYGNLIKDHSSVINPINRPPIPGMGGCDSFFVTHEWPETKDENGSSSNLHEAAMLVGLVDYLVLNGVTTEEITILTFYNGQRKLILKCLREHVNLGSRRSSFKVVTVDSYQGEENDIVLLSLVRSNEKQSIGFLDVENRVCVAISRAKRGFYIFGNGLLLCSQSETWQSIVGTMYGKQGEKPKTGPVRRVGYHIPLECQNHGRKTWVQDPSDWSEINGGCEEKCRCLLPCGHICMLRCHPFEASDINCTQTCRRKVEQCGHACTKICLEPCRCDLCERANKGALIKKHAKGAMFGAKQSFQHLHSSGSDPASWSKFANGGVKAADEALAARVAADNRHAVQQAYLENTQRLDDENAMLLFSEENLPMTPPSGSPLLRERGCLVDVDDTLPTRVRYQETFEVSALPKGNAPEKSLLDD